MKSKNVLADNPLDFIVSTRRAPSPTPLRPAVTDASDSPETKVVSPEEGRGADVPLARTDAPARPGQATSPLVMPGAAATVEVEGNGATELMLSDSGRSHANRIGTVHQPYTRKRDGVATRQASVTLPVEVLRQLGHCAVDTGMKPSEIMRAAVEEYLKARGY
jgi:hypothetical protein